MSPLSVPGVVAAGLPVVAYHAMPAAVWAAACVAPWDRSCTYLGSEPVAAYYARGLLDDGAPAVILEITLTALDPQRFEPDHPGLMEPITTVIGLDEDDIHAAWAVVEGTAADCWSLIGSCRYRGPIPATAIRLHRPCVAPMPM